MRDSYSNRSFRCRRAQCINSCGPKQVWRSKLCLLWHMFVGGRVQGRVLGMGAVMFSPVHDINNIVPQVSGLLGYYLLSLSSSYFLEKLYVKSRVPSVASSSDVFSSCQLQLCSLPRFKLTFKTWRAADSVDGMPVDPASIKSLSALVLFTSLSA